MSIATLRNALLADLHQIRTRRVRVHDMLNASGLHYLWIQAVHRLPRCQLCIARLLFHCRCSQPCVICTVRSPPSAERDTDTESQWRYLLFALGLMCELSVILAPFPFSQASLDTLSIQAVTSTVWSSPESLKTLITPQLTRPPLSALPLTVLAFLFPSRVPYQHVKFIHQLSVFLSMALTRVAPILMPPPLADEYVAMERGKLLMSLVQAMEQESALPSFVSLVSSLSDFQT